MSVLSSFWNGFLGYLAQNEKRIPVIFSILKQVEPTEITDDSITLTCHNHGGYMFLEKRLSAVEKELFLYAHKKITVKVLESAVKSKPKEAPLLSFEPSPEDILSRSGIHGKHDFDNFAASPSNQVAYAASLAVSNNLGSAYNPLFLYGGVGVGKTHLTHAVARKILKTNPDKKVMFCPGDKFTNELIESIQEHTTPRFRKKYRNLDLLIVDDVQFIAGKNSVQEEFFNTFNAIVPAGGQIILTSDRPPNEIKNLEDRLRSRFLGGLIVDIQPPDFELRTAILLIKAQEKGIETDIEAAKIIAEQISDCRHLEGTLLSIYAKILGIKERIDLDVVESFFTQKVENKSHKVDPTDVIKAVCSYYNVRQSQIKSPLRTDSIALPRQIIMYILRDKLKMNLDTAAYTIKRKDHTTVMHASEKINRLIMKDPVFKKDIDNILSTLSLST
jgi:chromosomal replication initiator protein